MVLYLKECLMRRIAFRDILKYEPIGVKNGRELGKTTCMCR
jgi:hypothetical protein